MQRMLLKFLVAAALVVVIGGLVGVYYIFRDLPTIDELRQYRPNLISRVYSVEGELIGEYYAERRIAVPLDKAPPILVKAFLAAEDARFFDHHGMDFRGMLRAAFKNMLAGGYVQGASTITQQVARNIFLDKGKTMSRKFKEILLAYILDSRFTKQEILQLYLNHIYFGNGAYGIEMASQDYFGKPVTQLALHECALLAGMPKAPSQYSPFKNPGKARSRRTYVLTRMLELGFITQQQFAEADAKPVPNENRRIINLQYNNHAADFIKQQLIKKYGEDKVLKGGLTVFTSINAEFQRRAYDAIDQGLRELDKRHGLRKTGETLKPEAVAGFLKNGPQAADELRRGEIMKACVADVLVKEKKFVVKAGTLSMNLPFKDIAWAGSTPSTIFKIGDVVSVRVVDIAKTGVITVSLEQEPEIEGALVSVDPTSGFVKSLIGGRDFVKSQYNRAVQAQRQPGSSFKPYVYGASLEKGFTPVSILIDAPLTFQFGGKEWSPKNFDNKFYGPTSLRHALAMSRNIITIKLLEQVGVTNVTDFARRAGIESPIDQNLAMGLGSSSLTPMEMVRGFTTFASMGKRYDLQIITKVTDSDGKVLEENQPKFEQTISPGVCFVLTSMLKGVVEGGTATRAKVLGRPIAGKTGTTNNSVDAWFIGYTPNLVTGVWVGYDQPKTMGAKETGSRAALPIWINYSQYAEKSYPEADFMVPEGVSFVSVDGRTGLLSSDSSESTRFECFVEGTEPREAYDPARHRGMEQYLYLNRDDDKEKKEDPGW